MPFLYFITGFLFNAVEMCFYGLQMSIDVGSLCMKQKKFRWSIPDDEFLELLDAEIRGE